MTTQRLLATAAVFFAAAAVLAHTAWAGGWGGIYAYSDVRPATLGVHTLTLTRAELRGGHVAVWVGVDNDSQWLQAGIAYGTGDGHAFVAPTLYIERTGGHIVPVAVLRFGQPVTVRIGCVRASCVIRAAGNVLRAWVPRWAAYTKGESYETEGTNTYAGVIDGRQVSR